MGWETYSNTQPHKEEKTYPSNNATQQTIRHLQEIKELYDLIEHQISRINF